MLADEKAQTIKTTEGLLEQAKERALRAVSEMAELGAKLEQLRREREEAAAKAREALAAQAAKKAEEAAAAAAAGPQQPPSAALRKAIGEALAACAEAPVLVAKLCGVLDELLEGRARAAAAGPAGGRPPPPRKAVAAASSAAGPAQATAPAPDVGAQQVWRDFTQGLDDPDKRKVAEVLVKECTTQAAKKGGCAEWEYDERVGPRPRRRNAENEKVPASLWGFV
ncbi:unnamed protein product [Prorocentrum cordatum]|uniref:Uncharacterized protein n=1 Tax=Prorocentrum cordatum TaxID=2364126 RepID=A0ABN9P9Y9_9DINO|nr:unnamed protein product [Polarella glacialis]